MHRRTHVHLTKVAKAARIALPLIAAAALCGCNASMSDLSTGSLFKTNATPEPAAVAPGATAPAGAAAPGAAIPVAAPVDTSTPTDRALQVGAVTARALKCGYNFDPARLKAAYFADETARGTAPADLATLEKVYNVGFNGVNKGASDDPDYCSEKKTSEIKTDLNRLLAGNFSPPARKATKQAGVFDFLSNGDTADSGPAYGSQEWWDKQADKAGK